MRGEMSIAGLSWMKGESIHREMMVFSESWMWGLAACVNSGYSMCTLAQGAAGSSHAPYCFSWVRLWNSRSLCGLPHEVQVIERKLRRIVAQSATGNDAACRLESIPYPSKYGEEPAGMCLNDAVRGIIFVQKTDLREIDNIVLGVGVE